MSKTIENDIIQLMRRKDKRCIDLIYDHYADSLYGVIRRMVVDESLAQDVLQDSFMKVWKKSDQYDAEKSRLFTWLLAICRNTAIDLMRSRKNHLTSEIQTDDSNVYKIGTTEMNPDHVGIDDLLGQLEFKYREIIEALFFNGLTQQETSDELGIPLGTVKTRLKIGLRELRKAFGTVNLILLILIKLL